MRACRESALRACLDPQGLRGRDRGAGQLSTRRQDRQARRAASEESTLDRLVAGTPASRDRVVDAARALCIVVVTLWHWTLSVTHRTADGSLAMPNPIHAVPGGW